MKIFSVLLCAILLAGCAGTHPKGAARYDDFDGVKVEQMVGNNVAPTTFARSVLCLNARRETRRVMALTNAVVTSATNQLITAVTNQTISLSTNILYTVMTNLAPAQSIAPMAVVLDAAAAETNLTVAVTNTGPQITTNVTLSVASNASGTRAPNQLTANNQSIRTFNNQLTTQSNNFTVALMTNMVMTGETNLVVNYVTNISLVSATNFIVTPTNGVAYDYFLTTELIPPPEFTPLLQGESLVLLVDGARYGFTPGQAGTAFLARKGYVSAVYRVSPEILVAIANAEEVRVRMKGVNSAIERTMSDGSVRNFRDFIARYFVPEEQPAPTMPDRKVAALP